MCSFPCVPILRARLPELRRDHSPGSVHFYGSGRIANPVTQGGASRTGPIERRRSFHPGVGLVVALAIEALDARQPRGMARHGSTSRANNATGRMSRPTWMGSRHHARGLCRTLQGGRQQPVRADVALGLSPNP